MAGEFSTINVRLIANASGMDGGLNDAVGKVQGLGGKFGSIFEKGADIFESFKGGDFLGAIGGIAGALSKFAPVLTMVSTAFTAAKGVKDWYGENAEEDKKKKEAQDAIKQKERDEAQRRNERKAQETTAPLRAAYHLNEALTAQIATFGQSGNMAQIYATKLDLVRTGVLKAKDAFATLEALNPFERANRQFNDVLRNLDQAEFAARRLADKSKAKEISDQVQTPLQRAQKDFDEAKKLFGQGDLSRADFGRRAMGLLENLERLNPQGETQFARATREGSVEAARDALRAQQSQQLRDPADRLKAAIEAQRTIEEAQLRVQEDLLKKITGPGGVFQANF